MPAVRRLSLLGLALLPGALTAYMSFNAGGYFAGTPALVAVIVAAVLMLWVLLADDPFGALNGRLAIAAGAWGLYALWTIVSATWSHSPARAVIAFDRVLLYMFTIVLFGAVGGGAPRLRILVRGIALAIVIVCTAALVTRTLPHVFPVVPGYESARLSYPLTYWNALGILAGIGVVLCLELACSEKEPAPVRVLGAAAIPILATTLLFTFSRGGLAATGIGVVAFLVLARSRGLIGGVLAVVPPTAAALASAYGAKLLQGSDRTSAAAVGQGHTVALTVLGCVAAAALLRTLTLRFDRPTGRRPLAVKTRRRIGGALVAGLVLAVVLAFAAGGLGATVKRQYNRFVRENAVSTSGDPRARLSDPGNNGRLAIWRIALDGFKSNPAHGQGAGTYRLLWESRRPQAQVVDTSHSLYLEALDELGVPGLALVVIGLAAILIGLAVRIRGPDRAVYAAVFAATLAWAIHAGVDWDWEMPAVTVWLFACAGVALGSPRRPGRPVRGSAVFRAGVALAVAVLAATPALAAASQMRLDSAVYAFDRGDCATAIKDGLSAASALGARPEPWEVIGYCDARLGAPNLAVKALQSAVDRDPKDWEFHYGLALVSADAGLDPRPAAAAALALNPREPLAKREVAAFARGGAARRKRAAASLPYDIP